MAAFAVTVPVNALSVDTSGWLCPAGQVVRKASGPEGTAVIFNEYAWADDGIPQLELLENPVDPGS